MKRYKHSCPDCRCPVTERRVKRLHPDATLTLPLARKMVETPAGNDAWLRRRPWATEAEAANFIAQFSEGQRWRVLACIASANDKKGRLDYEVHRRTGIHKNDVASRRKELEERGWVKALPDVHRPTENASGMAWAMTPWGRLVWEYDIEPYL